MLVLADQPATLASLAPAGTPPASWRPAAGLDPATLAIWQALAGDIPGWTLEIGTPGFPRNPLEPVPGPAFWSRLVLVSHVTASSFDTLHHRLGDAVREVGPTACVALSGEGLHGFHGRTWVASPGNLHLSAAMDLRLPAAATAPALTMLLPVAVIDAICAVTRGALRPGVKWVSDVLLGEAKIAGTIAATHVRGDEIDLAAVGIGLNVSTVPAVAATPFVPSASCLRAHAGGNVTLGAVLWHVLAALADRVIRLRAEGPGPLALDYRQASLVIGRQVRVWDEPAAASIERGRAAAPSAAGRVVDIDRNLRLHLHGQVTPVESGRLAFEETCQAFGV